MNSRQAALGVIRGLAVLLGLSSIATAASGILRVHMEHRHWPVPQPYWVYKDELSWAIPIFVVAFLLWILQRPLSRLIVPRVGRMCAECGYDLRALKGDRCPECGARVQSQSSTAENSEGTDPHNERSKS